MSHDRRRDAQETMRLLMESGAFAGHASTARVALTPVFWRQVRRHLFARPKNTHERSMPARTMACEAAWRVVGGALGGE